MKVIEKSKGNQVGKEIGEAYLEVSADGKTAYLQAISNSTGELIRYCNFIKSDTTTAYDFELINQKLDMIISQISHLNSICETGWYGSPSISITKKNTTNCDYVIGNAASPVMKK